MDLNTSVEAADVSCDVSCRMRRKAPRGKNSHDSVSLLCSQKQAARSFARFSAARVLDSVARLQICLRTCQTIILLVLLLLRLAR